ncbi:hypothetical protein Agabi119p4_3398 [Agaricus bisporus var. burnettii]|uniref:Uncharacterized protein n=1 Tax=Agaricus bisporus var. burnettii TaxID=192524 RepID=A0A8H7F708_AGABI|nr:hypothetical protein Agabi119p4_3398 [Agaricus bisporus var. burnettii]
MISPLSLPFEHYLEDRSCQLGMLSKCCRPRESLIFVINDMVNFTPPIMCSSPDQAPRINLIYRSRVPIWSFSHFLVRP